jgi:hypothetical protein
MFLVTVKLVDLLARPHVHLALELPAARLRPTLPDSALGLSLDALHGRVRHVVLLIQRVRHFLDRKACALPFHAVDRAAAEQSGEREKQAATTEQVDSRH